MEISLWHADTLTVSIGAAAPLRRDSWRRFPDLPFSAIQASHSLGGLWYHTPCIDDAGLPMSPWSCLFRNFCGQTGSQDCWSEHQEEAKRCGWPAHSCAPQSSSASSYWCATARTAELSTARFWNQKIATSPSLRVTSSTPRLRRMPFRRFASCPKLHPSISLSANHTLKWCRRPLFVMTPCSSRRSAHSSVPSTDMASFAVECVVLPRGQLQTLFGPSRHMFQGMRDVLIQGLFDAKAKGQPFLLSKDPR